MTAQIISLAARRAEPVLVVTTAPAAPATETPPNAGEAVALLAGACRALMANLATMQRHSLNVVDGMAAMKDVALSIADGSTAVSQASQALSKVSAVTRHG